MRQQSREYIVILFITALLAINYPALDLFNRHTTIFGIPLLYFYLYVAWLVLIIVLIPVIEQSEIREAETLPKPQARSKELPPITPPDNRNQPPESS